MGVNDFQKNIVELTIKSMIPISRMVENGVGVDKIVLLVSKPPIDMTLKYYFIIPWIGLVRINFIDGEYDKYYFCIVVRR